MKTVEIGGKRVELYDSIEELPIVRFHKYSKMSLIDAGIGSDIADFDRHIGKAVALAKGKNPSDAAVEIENLRQSVYFIQNNLSPKYLSFAALVKSIDGRPCDDLSDEGLKKVVDELSQAPHGKITALLDAVKKKMEEELRLYFPQLFDDAREKEYYDTLRRRTSLILEKIEKGNADESVGKEIGRLSDELATFYRPQVFTGTDSVEIRHDKSFGSVCLIMAQNLHVDPKRFSVMEYYNALSYMQEEAKRKKKALKK